jgi:hypothetical protein
MADALTRPDLTLPEAEASALRSAYGKARTILEYGSGGSTLVAAELGADVVSVESDADWAAMMRAWFDAHPAKGNVRIEHVDIGSTRDWGYPADDSGFRKWPDYALKIWDSPGFRHPDVVLIDGRFRLGCFLTTAYRITRPVTVLFDDYAPRAAYHKAAEVQPPTEMIGRMARFDLHPQAMTADRVRSYLRALLQPQ